MMSHAWERFPRIRGFLGLSTGALFLTACSVPSIQGIQDLENSLTSGGDSFSSMGEIALLPEQVEMQGSYDVYYTQILSGKDTIVGEGNVSYEGVGCSVSMEYREETSNGDSTVLYRLVKPYNESMFLVSLKEEGAVLDVQDPASIPYMQHSLPLNILPGATTVVDRYDVCSLPYIQGLIDEETGEWDVEKYVEYQSDSLMAWVEGLRVIPPEFGWLESLLGADVNVQTELQGLQDMIPVETIGEVLKPYTPGKIVNLGRGRIFQFGVPESVYTEIVLTPTEEQDMVTTPEGALPYSPLSELGLDGIGLQEVLDGFLNSFR